MWEGALRSLVFPPSVLAAQLHAELWLDGAHSVALYLRTWNTLRESAVYGADAHNVISAARRALNLR